MSLVADVVHEQIPCQINFAELLSLKDSVFAERQDHEEEIARYLESAPSYSALGKVVGDVLDPDAKAVLFPGKNTDGVYVWPAELAYYVRKYHIRLPQPLIERMVALSWQPPAEEDIDWENMGLGFEDRTPSD